MANRIYSIEDLLFTAAEHALGWAVAPQIKAVIDNPFSIHEQNGNAIRMGLEWLQGIRTGCAEVDDMVRDWISIITDATNLPKRQEE